MKHFYKLYINGLDITQKFGNRLLSITAIDSIGMENDNADISIDNGEYYSVDNVTKQGIVYPSPGDLIEVELGYLKASDLVNFDATDATANAPLSRIIGEYILDKIAVSYPPHVLKITAKKLPYDSSTKNTFSRVWEKEGGNVSLYEIMTDVIKSMGRTPKIAEELKNIVVDYAIQQNQSDMTFLAMLASSYGYTCKIEADSDLKEIIYVMLPATTYSFTNKVDLKQDVFSLKVRMPSVISYNYEENPKAKFTGIVAKYETTDTKTKARISSNVKIGEVGKDKIFYTLPSSYDSEGKARSAAESFYRKLLRETKLLNISIYGDPRFKAERILTLDNFPTQIPKEWIIKKATHRYSGQGYYTDIEAEYSNDKEIEELLKKEREKIKEKKELTKKNKKNRAKNGINLLTSEQKAVNNSFSITNK